VEKIITECSVCKKVKEEGTSEELWINRRILSRVLNDPDIQVSHGYCPECREKLKKTIRSKKNESPEALDPEGMKSSVFLSPEVEGLLNALIKKGLIDRAEALDEIRKLLPSSN
jgi:hypothetical protein